jgi:hypothetical protein
MNIKAIVTLFVLSVSVASCKKEEQKTCPQPHIPYTSLMESGDSAIVRAFVFQLMNPNGCDGYFLEIYSGNPEKLDGKVSYYKIVNPLPEYVRNYPDLANVEWVVDVDYLGVGLECYIIFGVDPAPGYEPEPDNIELVNVNYIELLP